MLKMPFPEKLVRNDLNIQFFLKKYFSAWVQVYEPTSCCSRVTYVEYITFEVYFMMLDYYNEYVSSGQTLPTIFIFKKWTKTEVPIYIFQMF